MFGKTFVGVCLAVAAWPVAAGCGDGGAEVGNGSATVTGTVTYYSEEPAPKVTVGLAKGSIIETKEAETLGTTESDDDGRYEFSGVEAGEYSVVVSAENPSGEGGCVGDAEFTVEEGQDATVDVTCVGFASS